MNRLANYSGQEVVIILKKKFNFFFVTQKGSHIKLRRDFNGKIITVIVPDHHELAPGTLYNILRQGEISVADFISQ